MKEPEIKIIRIETKDTIATSESCNGSGKHPNGWNNPNNPHYNEIFNNNKKN